MTEERYNALMDHLEQGLTKEEISEGWHFCYSWDGLLIAPHMVEWECCECFDGGKKLPYTGPLMGDLTEEEMKLLEKDLGIPVVSEKRIPIPDSPIQP